MTTSWIKCFPIGGSIEWSFEEEESLRKEVPSLPWAEIDGYSDMLGYAIWRAEIDPGVLYIQFVEASK